MFARICCVLLWISPIIFYFETCNGNLAQTYLSLYSPGDPEYTDVIVRKIGDNLTLACELKGDPAPLPRIFVWNYVPSANSTEDEKVYKTEPRGPALGSRLTKPDLQEYDSGHYVCSAPPFSVTKYILVQQRSKCGRGALWCGHCVLGTYVCDGFVDCPHAEDESPKLCLPNVCNRADKLNCSSGRCVSEAACCRPPAPLCQHPSCCDEHAPYSKLQVGWSDEYPPLFEDRHAPDEYGFIQSTIYTVTACALIFMIAVVLLVSAICKMHMKRAALRSYTQRPARLSSLPALNARQLHRFPPCYEASRLLEAERLGAPPPLTPPHSPPDNTEQWRSECGEDDQDLNAGGFGLRLSSLFSSRYRQVSTSCVDVELRSVPPSPRSPARAPPPLPMYRPTATHDDYFLHPEISDCGRDLNIMAGELLRRNQREARPLTLQLGRFQLSIPRLGRRASDRRPDTPNVAEINIDDLDFVRLNSNETYTLNGRTIRLLGADFENYPVLNDSVRPPPYTDSMRYKLYGPPPEYLSRDTLNNEREVNTPVTEEQARRNVEMPPGYDELSDSNGNNVITVIAVTETNDNNTQCNTDTVVASDGNANNVENVTVNSNDNVENTQVTSLSAVIDDLPAIDDVNANGLDYLVTVGTIDNSVAGNNNGNVTNNNEC